MGREIWRGRVVHLVVLAKKIVNFFRKKVHTRKNPGYAYEFAHPWKKSCGSPRVYSTHSWEPGGDVALGWTDDFIFTPLTAHAVCVTIGKSAHNVFPTLWEGQTLDTDSIGIARIFHAGMHSLFPRS